MKLRQTAVAGRTARHGAGPACAACSSSEFVVDRAPPHRLVFVLVVGRRSAALKTGLKVFVIPKNLGNSYFTTADSAKSGGAIAALRRARRDRHRDQRHRGHPGVADPGHPGRDQQGRERARSSPPPTRPRCARRSTSAMKRGITVVTYDSDAPTCRSLFINQASTAQHRRPARSTCSPSRSTTPGRSRSSRRRLGTNQNAWIGYMKQELKKYPKMTLVSTVYGNDDTGDVHPGDPGPARAVPEPEGHHLADHGRDRGRGGRPRHAPSTAARSR